MAVQITAIDKVAKTATIRILLADISGLVAQYAKADPVATKGNFAADVLMQADAELQAAANALRNGDAALDARVAALQAEIAALKAARPAVP